MKYLGMKHFSQPKIGFTLAEIMVVLFVLTVILAAFAPIMTTRTKTGGTSPWRYASPDTANAYFGALDNQTAMIGQSTKSSDDIDSKLIINTPDDDTAAILFKQDGTNLAQLFLDSNKNIILGGGTSSVFEGSSYNTALGYNALSQAISSLNTAIGGQALNSLTNGTRNTAVGGNAATSLVSGSENTVLGIGAAISLNQGDNNTVIGANSLVNVSTGEGITAIGAEACNGVESSAVYVTCIGAFSGPAAAAPSVNALYLGNSLTNTYNLGTLDVTEETTLNSTLYVAGATEIDNSLDVTADAKVQNDLEVGGIAYFAGVGSVYLGSTNLAAYLSSITSDKRLKNITGENNTGLDKIKQMKTYDYTLKSDKKSTTHTGVIAQEVQKFFPEAVFTDEDGYLKIRKDALFFAVVNAIKELAAHDSDKDLKIQELEKKNAELEERLLKLEEKIETLSAKTQKKK